MTAFGCFVGISSIGLIEATLMNYFVELDLKLADSFEVYSPFTLKL
jgi:hypothetical protein